MVVALGIIATRDISANRFYPTHGGFLNITGDFFTQGLGSKYSFQAYRFTFSKYVSLSERQVLAYNAFVCLTGGRPPFYGNCIYGTNNQLRGYTAGRYLDRYMLTTQLEYRLVLPKRFGLVGFGGLGGVIRGADQPRKSHFLPDIGTGLRFELSKKYHVNVNPSCRCRSGNWQLYMGNGSGRSVLTRATVQQPAFWSRAGENQGDDPSDERVTERPDRKRSGRQRRSVSNADHRR